MYIRTNGNFSISPPSCNICCPDVNIDCLSGTNLINGQFTIDPSEA
ncbi:hypothetical protein GM555_03765 [Commensalibacter sp. ESL0366]|nr:hypothetical protein [Commensalibacter melissae]